MDYSTVQATSFACEDAAPEDYTNSPPPDVLRTFKLASSILLFILLLGIAHAQEMTEVLSNDIEDQAEREGITWKNKLENAEHNGGFKDNSGTTQLSNNQEKLMEAEKLALVTVVFLYTSSIVTAIYVFGCILAIVGAIKRTPDLLVPYLLIDLLGLALFFAFLWGADQHEGFVSIFWGHWTYRTICLIVMLFNIHMWLTICTYHKTLKKQISLDSPSMMIVPTKVPTLIDPDEVKVLPGSAGMRHSIIPNVENII